MVQSRSGRGGGDAIDAMPMRRARDREHALCSSSGGGGVLTYVWITAVRYGKGDLL